MPSTRANPQKMLVKHAKNPLFPNLDVTKKGMMRTGIKIRRGRVMSRLVIDGGAATAGST